MIIVALPTPKGKAKLLKRLVSNSCAIRLHVLKRNERKEGDTAVVARYYRAAVPR
jgi:hypothetical protein